MKLLEWLDLLLLALSELSRMIWNLKIFSLRKVLVFSFSLLLITLTKNISLNLMFLNHKDGYKTRIISYLIPILDFLEDLELALESI